MQHLFSSCVVHACVSRLATQLLVFCVGAMGRCLCVLLRDCCDVAEPSDLPMHGGPGAMIRERAACRSSYRQIAQRGQGDELERVDLRCSQPSGRLSSTGEASRRKCAAGWSACAKSWTMFAELRQRQGDSSYLSNKSYVVERPYQRGGDAGKR